MQHGYSTTAPLTKELIWCRAIDRQISTHIMHMEIYRDAAEFCATHHYQEWLARWQPPQAAQVDLWVDHEQEWQLLQTTMTPRHQALTRWATRVQFYLLHSLEIGDLPCVDVGCGHNWLRQFHAQIWGVDPHHAQHRDQQLTPEWWIPNWGQWPRAISINALHFCDQWEIPHQMAKVRGLLSPGGRAVVTLNRRRIQELTQDYQEDRLRDQLSELPGLTRMVWLDEPSDAVMDGNVWLWLVS